MKEEAERLRAALSECGLFQGLGEEESDGPVQPSDTAESPAEEIDPAGAQPQPQPAEVESGPGILEALDRVFDNKPDAPAVLPAAPVPSRPPEPVHRMRQEGSAPEVRSEIQPLLERAMAIGLEQLHLSRDGGAFAVSGRLCGQRLEVGSVTPSFIERAFAGRSAGAVEFRTVIHDVARSFVLCRVRTARDDHYTIQGLPRWSPASIADLGIAADTAAATSNLLQHDTSGLFLVLSRRGDAARATVEAAARECLRSGRMVATRIPADDPRGANRMVEFAKDAGVQDMMACEPDVLALGPCADFIGMGEAVRAAAAGYRVLASMPALSVEAAIAVLGTLQIDRTALLAAHPTFFLQTSLRALCGACRERCETPPRFDFDEAAVSPNGESFYRAVGCARCRQGTTGRILAAKLYENDFITFLAHGGEGAASRSQLFREVRSAAVAGRTSVEEALRLHDELCTKD